jgi:hypothetical protein
MSSIGPLGGYPSGYGYPSGTPARQAAQAMEDIMHRVEDLERNPENAQSDWDAVLQDVQTLTNLVNQLTPTQQTIVYQIKSYFGPPHFLQLQTVSLRNS